LLPSEGLSEAPVTPGNAGHESETHMKKITENKKAKATTKKATKPAAKKAKATLTPAEAAEALNLADLNMAALKPEARAGVAAEVAAIEAHVARTEAAAAAETAERRASMKKAAQADAAKRKALKANPPAKSGKRSLNPAVREEAAAAEAKGPREGSKKALVLAAVESKQGASRKALAEATGWSEAFVHGFLGWTVKRHLAATGRALAAAKNKETGDWNYRVA
jgi:hypothetical protein